MHYIHHLRSLSVGHAMKALEMYITTRLATDDENLWTENAVITLIWMMATPLQMTFVVPPDFQDTLDRILQTWKSVLSPAAAHAALVVSWVHFARVRLLRLQFIWKAVEHTIDEDQWCQFALHEMFKNAGDGNIGKVERTLIQFHLDQSNVDAAHDVWEKMSPARKRHDLSRYLQYCIALRRGDDTAVWSALTSLATVHDDRNKLLFVAVSKAMKYGTNAQTAQLLHRILEKYKDRLPAEVDAFALSRCTARLLIRALEENDKPSDELLSRLCAVFKSALLLLQRQDTTEARCTASILADCKWFEQASFTCAISNWKSWPARFVIDLLQYSCETQYPPNSPGESQIEKFLHEVTTSFAQAALYTAEARSASADWTIEDLPRSAYSSKSPPLPANIKKTLYRHVFDKSTNLKRRYNELQRDWPDATPAMLEDVGRQVVAVSPLALEAMLFLGSHEHAPVAELSLNQIIDQAIQLRPTTRQYSSLVDMVLCAASVVPIQGDVNEEVRRGSRLPIITATQLLAKLIQGVRSHSDYATPEASRWIRCVVQIALDGRGSDKGLVSAYDEKALKTLDMITYQALILARSGSEDDIPGRDNRNQYPSEELEWLSTTLFNLSIDLYISQMELRSAAEEPVVDSSEESTESKSDLMQPQMWAAKAVEFADILARPVQLSDGQENAAVAEGADWGMLARVLRDRCKGFGWHV
ncbi:hypothetical protein EDD37DRAFT_455181 [Exophiala viscosa]|uniref:uncharacterized protein n=1 Tax=Exophiala viscosa TaxID=2486360 RepID=UPI0021928B74|nr:hypothetical protein EDD37DRAFT_455181 [Exophiala viscosa]